jgi:uncharacterized protein with NRDE domain
MDNLRESIFIPRFATAALPSMHTNGTKAHSETNSDWSAIDQSRWYGTREQTVILVSRDDGRVIFTERTLWDDKVQPISKQEGQVREEFHIEGWNDDI